MDREIQNQKDCHLISAQSAVPRDPHDHLAREVKRKEEIILRLNTYF